MKKIFSLIGIIVITAILSVVATMFMVDASETPNTYQIRTINSEILNEKREIIVKLPQNYQRDSSKKYPVVYVFGGNTLTYSIAYDVELLHRTGHLVELIVVGVPNISQKTRQRDLTPPFMKQDIDENDSPLGNADNYLKFIENEVIQLIETSYRTSNKRIAIGHSREGLMVSYALVTNPSLFQGHIALSPAYWRENHIFLDFFERSLQKVDSLETRFFLTMGELEVPKMKDAFDAMNVLLSSKETKHKLRSEHLYLPKADHSNNGLLSAPIAIQKLLEK